MQYGWGSWRTKKPTTAASRGFLSKFSSSATSPAGVAVDYDDYQQSKIYLQRDF
jgi:hypothetical protein